MWLFKLFPCKHANWSFPVTPKGRKTYRVCLDCGWERNYSWERMEFDDKVKGSSSLRSSSYKRRSA